VSANFNHFGELLLGGRTRLGLTREVLAGQVSLHASYIYRLETGERRPSREVVLSLAEALEVEGQALDMWLLAAGLAPAKPFAEARGAVRTRGGVNRQMAGTEEPASLQSIGLQEAILQRLLDMARAATPSARERVAQALSGAVSSLLDGLESPVRTAVIPAAKENAHVALAVMQRMVLRTIGEASRSGIFDIILVLSPGMVESIYAPLREALAITNSPPIALRYCLQRRPEGLGDAVLEAKGLVGGGPFAVMLPDDIVHEEAEGGGRPTELRRMAAALAVEADSNLLMVTQVPRSKLAQYGVALVEGLGDAWPAVTQLIEKPDPQRSSLLPSRALGVVGRYILQSEVFGPLGELKAGGARPLHLTSALSMLLDAGGKVRAYELKSARRDLGEALTKASDVIRAVSVR
jgi:dTDP-glucose pyrophosphorylase/transcriptional regulator with XRE-family HTH domain